MHDPIGEVLRDLGDAISFGTLFAVLIQALPTIATILTIIWMGIRIYESKTVQRSLGRIRDRDVGDPDQ
jgi:hypothetical protein